MCIHQFQRTFPHGHIRIAKRLTDQCGTRRRIGEKLARIWHDRLIVPALGAMTAAIAAGQARGEIRPGDPRHYAISLISPLLVGVIWRETFTPIGAEPFDIPALAEQHVETLLRGMILESVA